MPLQLPRLPVLLESIGVVAPLRSEVPGARCVGLSRLEDLRVRVSELDGDVSLELVLESDRLEEPMRPTQVDLHGKAKR